MSAYVHAEHNDRNKQPTSLSEALSEFDRAVNNRFEYESANFNRIDSIKRLIEKAETDSLRLNLIETVGRSYRGVQIDSALRYFTIGRDMALSLNDSSQYAKFEALRCTQLPLLGEGFESISNYMLIDTGMLKSSSDTAIYLQSGANIHFTLAGYYSDSEMRNNHIRNGIEYAKKLINYLPEDSALTDIVLAHLYFYQGKSALVEAMLNDILDYTPQNTPYFGFAAWMLGNHYYRTKDYPDALYYMTLAAIHELKSGQLKGSALYKLGMMMLEQGNIERGQLCISLALENSVRSGEKIRTMQSGEYVPMLTNGFNKKSKKLIIWISVCVALLLLSTTGVILLVRRLQKARSKIEEMKEIVSDADYMKGTYISQFLNLCSIYMEKLEEFNRVARRKITAGQIDDLYALLKSGKMLDEQSTLFYEIFDNAFLHVYPTFIDEVNALLQKDKQIIITSPKHLTTELRIFAFTRLGIDDSAQIARFLNLSLNTIYTYRNKMRSRAIDRDTFEESVMSIGQTHIH